MRDDLASQIIYEVSQLDRLLSEYGPLLAALERTPPDAVQTAAVASVLHSFYTGVETLLSRLLARGYPAAVVQAALD